MDRDLIPATYQLLRIDVPADIAIDAIDAGMLSADWRAEPIASRRIGDQWLD